MALTTCGDCGAQFSDKAPACLRCGAPRPGRFAWLYTVGIWVAWGAIALIAAAVVYAVTRDPVQEADREVYHVVCDDGEQFPEDLATHCAQKLADYRATYNADP
ncbi:MAG: hypothetical protein ACOH2M_27145 [Cypionkella sp.]